MRLIIAACLLALPIAASADVKGDVRANCTADVKANCGMVFSRDKALACLVENAARLSVACKSSLEKASCDARAPANVRATFACKE